MHESRLRTQHLEQELLVEEQRWETPGVHQIGLRYFQSERYHKNIQLLQGLQALAQTYDPEYASTMPDTWFPLLTMPSETACTAVHEMKSAPEITPHLRLWRQHGSGPEDYLCPVSHTHGSDYEVLREASHWGVPLRQIGLIVIDRHADIAPVTIPGHMTKNSVLYHLLKAGIGGIGIYGIDSDTLDAVETAPSVRYDTTEPSTSAAHIAQVAQTYRDRLTLADVLQDGTVDHAHLDQQLAATIANFARRGITSVLFSFDMDGNALLEEQISATAYSPYETISAMGLQDLTLPLRKKLGEAGMHRLQEAIDTVWATHHHSWFHRRLTATDSAIYQQAIDAETDLLEAKSSIRYPTAYTPAAFHGLPVLFQQKGGFHPTDIALLTSRTAYWCKKNRMHIGVPYDHGRLVATVSEVVGKDYHRHTEAMIRSSFAAACHAAQLTT